MKVWITVGLIALVACDSSPPAGVDAAAADAASDAGEPTSEPLAPDECEEFTSLYAYMLVPREARATRAWVGPTLSFPGELLAFYVDRDQVAAGELHALNPTESDAVLAVLGTGCVGETFDSCERVWAPNSGRAYFERLGGPGEEMKVSVGNLLWAPARLEDDSVRFTNESGCRFYERMNLGGTVVSDSCTSPSLLCRLASAP